MLNEPRWLTAGEVEAINENVVALTGEPFFLMDPGLLESAVGVPYSNWSYGGESSLAALACHLLFAVARNHPFAQGNKRTGLQAALIFLQANGYDLALGDTAYFADLIIMVLGHEYDLHDFITTFEAFVVEIEDWYPEPFSG